RVVGAKRCNKESPGIFAISSHNRLQCAYGERAMGSGRRIACVPRGAAETGQAEGWKRRRSRRMLDCRREDREGRQLGPAGALPQDHRYHIRRYHHREKDLRPCAWQFSGVVLRIKYAAAPLIAPFDPGSPAIPILDCWGGMTGKSGQEAW